ncbi:MAG: hypothetical protein M3220_19155 [Chloroflexota bacterium]|nr:hypothetical protein [Chloroflexota bacterium]
MTLTFVDSGVLIAAARGIGPLSPLSLLALDAPGPAPSSRITNFMSS